jgi:hypothetical protein
MSEENKGLIGPDLANGFPAADVAEGGMILGRIAGEAVVTATASRGVDSVFEAGYLGNSADDYHPARRRAQV